MAPKATLLAGVTDGVVVFTCDRRASRTQRDHIQQIHLIQLR